MGHAERAQQLYVYKSYHFFSALPPLSIRYLTPLPLCSVLTAPHSVGKTNWLEQQTGMAAHILTHFLTTHAQNYLSSHIRPILMRLITGLRSANFCLLAGTKST